ncbi:caveolin-1-like [Ruditapes philippinarum]|uniref:caveolin-1-like n=1 Tax=Ruditapes philippinarum TaxID=129788 RepID=UPI00295C3106|nr:caveolin-1-like [Ruditapes philippinarum]
MGDVDLINRDPNAINPHLKCAFEDVLAEPDDIHSMDFCWNLSYSCFNFWKNCCYKLSTFLCGCCIAIELGCEFAGLAFTHIWCITPCLRIVAINCTPYQKLWGVCCNCCVSPVCEACGMYWSQIKINMQKS